LSERIGPKTPEGLRSRGPKTGSRSQASTWAADGTIKHFLEHLPLKRQEVPDDVAAPRSSFLPLR
jgi:hypothetical protein